MQSAANISPTFSCVNGNDTDGPCTAVADGIKDGSDMTRFGCGSEDDGVTAPVVVDDACKDLVDGE